MKNCFKIETMQKIIYEILCRQLENEDGYSYGASLSMVAREIAAAIAPHLEAGAGWEDRVIVDLREKIGKVKRNIELDRESVALSYCDKIDDVLCKLM